MIKMEPCEKVIWRSGNRKKRLVALYDRAGVKVAIQLRELVVKTVDYFPRETDIGSKVTVVAHINYENVATFTPREFKAMIRTLNKGD